MHLLGSAFEETSTAADEHGIAGEDSAIAAVFVLEEKADRVLGVAGCVEGCDLDIADFERPFMLKRLGDLGAVTTTDYRQVKFCQLTVQLVRKLILVMWEALQFAHCHQHGHDGCFNQVSLILTRRRLVVEETRQQQGICTH